MMGFGLGHETAWKYAVCRCAQEKAYGVPSHIWPRERAAFHLTIEVLRRHFAFLQEAAEQFLGAHEPPKQISSQD